MDSSAIKASVNVVIETHRSWNNFYQIPDRERLLNHIAEAILRLQSDEAARKKKAADASSDRDDN